MNYICIWEYYTPIVILFATFYLIISYIYLNVPPISFYSLCPEWSC